MIILRAIIMMTVAKIKYSNNNKTIKSILIVIIIRIRISIMITVSQTTKIRTELIKQKIYFVLPTYYKRDSSRSLTLQRPGGGRGGGLHRPSRFLKTHISVTPNPFL